MCIRDRSQIILYHVQQTPSTSLQNIISDNTKQLTQQPNNRLARHTDNMESAYGNKLMMMGEDPSGPTGLAADSLLEAYAHYFQDFTCISELDHLADEFYQVMVGEMFGYSEASQDQGVIVMEQNMGIAYYVFQILHPICKEIIFAHKEALYSRERLPKEISQELFYSSRILLCLNGEVNTAINVRRELLLQKYISNLQEELDFIKVISLKFKKSSGIWLYRKVLVKEFIERNKLQKGADLRVFLAKERDFLKLMGEKHPRNYYLWEYRRFLMIELAIRELGNIEILNEELEYLHSICAKNVHDYSGFHYLQNLLMTKREVQGGGDINLEYEIAWVSDLINTYRGLYNLESRDYNSLDDHERDLIKLESLNKHKNILQKWLKEKQQTILVCKFPRYQ
eukprot:TRINITY_DN3032_c0_g3_i1.p2 TRINITY_DN3032_c0_g3~~TRINITY_DN3032_c0_g3_i1.p2  ORF type:complete len:413 (-),score=67.95 TRINITY_DN3032_c0_g3_i1:1158-2348(-)